MPTYVYRCNCCGEFEVHQSIKDPPLEQCPDCGTTVRRVITGGTVFILKGHGATKSNCDRETPCCGREVRCEKLPCGK